MKHEHETDEDGYCLTCVTYGYQQGRLAAFEDAMDIAVRAVEHQRRVNTLAGPAAQKAAKQ